MHLTFRNVNDAFRGFVELFNREQNRNSIIGRRPSRNGEVLVIDEPVLVTYTHPRERVLFNTVRDANPFFHLYHALWILAGRNDVGPLAYYVKKFREFSDDGVHLNGAYGYRWRCAAGVPKININPDGSNSEYSRPGVDQIDLLVAHLKADPASRRAVLQMWNVEDDLLKIGRKPSPVFHMGGVPCREDQGDQASKDVCCNLSVMFSLRMVDCEKCEGSGLSDSYPILSPCQFCNDKGTFFYLDITVTNRSNDLVWGMLGEDFVTFSVLQEYVAARLGVEVGRYHHFSNNLHVYSWNWKPEEWLADQTPGYDSIDVASRIHGKGGLKTIPLIRDPEVFERELPLFVGAFNGEEEPWSCVPRWNEPFFQEVAGPMLTALRRHKEGGPDAAMTWALRINSDDWRIAATDWIKRRVDKKAIPIATDGRCKCNCGTKCPLGRTGMEYRCTAEELTAAGVKIKQLG